MSTLTLKAACARMERAREETAKELLEWEAVAEAISTAAGKGYGLALFAPPAGVSIKATETATATVERLRSVGFRTEWRERRDPGDVLTHELAVSWDAPPVGGQ